MDFGVQLLSWKTKAEQATETIQLQCDLEPQHPLLSSFLSLQSLSDFVLLQQDISFGCVGTLA